jgi:hypothetical protein
MADAEASSSSRYADEALRVGIGQMRDTAKWLIVTFGAVANAFILAGIGLSHLSNVQGTHRDVALFAVAVAVSSVLVPVIAASRVLTAGQITYSDLVGDSRSRRNLRAAMATKTDLFPGYDSIATFVGDMTAAAVEQSTTVQALFDGSGGDAERQSYERANEKIRTLRPLEDRLLLVAAFTDVRRQLSLSRTLSAISFALLAAAAVTFALAIKHSVPRSPPVLSRLTVKLTPSGRNRLGSRLGLRCDQNRVEVVVLGKRSRDLQVAVLPANACKLVLADLRAADFVIAGPG